MRSLCSLGVVFWGGSSCKFLWVSWLLGFMRYLVDANHLTLVVTLCSSFRRGNGHPGCSFADHSYYKRNPTKLSYICTVWSPPHPPKRKQKMGPIYNVPNSFCWSLDIFQRLLVGSVAQALINKVLLVWQCLSRKRHLGSGDNVDASGVPQHLECILAKS